MARLLCSSVTKDGELLDYFDDICADAVYTSYRIACSARLLRAGVRGCHGEEEGASDLNSIFRAKLKRFLGAFKRKSLL